MPNPGADRPLRKVTLNLYEEDCAELEKYYGYGWSTLVRDWIHNSTLSIRSYQQLKNRTLGDLDE